MSERDKAEAPAQGVESPRKEACDECHGKGYYPDTAGREPGESCNYCDGTGARSPSCAVSSCVEYFCAGQKRLDGSMRIARERPRYSRIIGKTTCASFRKLNAAT